MPSKKPLSTRALRGALILGTFRIKRKLIISLLNMKGEKYRKTDALMLLLCNVLFFREKDKVQSPNPMYYAIRNFWWNFNFGIITLKFPSNYDVVYVFSSRLLLVGSNIVYWSLYFFASRPWIGRQSRKAQRTYRRTSEGATHLTFKYIHIKNDKSRIARWYIVWEW